MAAIISFVALVTRPEQPRKPYVVGSRATHVPKVIPDFVDTAVSPYYIFVLLIVGGLIQYVLLVALFRAESRLVHCVSRWLAHRSTVTAAAARKERAVTEDGDLHSFDDVDVRR